MKTLNLNFRNLALVAVVALGLITVSCDKQDDMFQEQSSTVQDADLKKGKAVSPGDKSIAAIAIEAGFSELVSALAYVDGAITPSPGLVNLFLTGKDQYTVFAPTNQAFMNLYAALNVTKISDLPAGLVLNVLLYHVTDGRRAANSVVPPVNSKEIETLLPGSTFSVDKNGMITAVGNTAKITSANISASNGIIHVIDAVILPIVP